MKKFYVEKEVFDILPNLNVGVLVLKNVQENKTLEGTEAEEIKKILDTANKEAKRFLTSDTISENEVVKIWREAYSAFPTKKGARCSLENLLKRVLHDNPVGTILPSVDITNAISLKYAFPIGAEDLDKIDGNLRLGIMNGDEKFIPIGKETEEPPIKGEIAYRDDFGAVCRCLNWRDGIRTEITDDTTYEFIAMECLEPNRIEELKEALDQLEKLMCQYLDAETVTKTIITKEEQEVEI